MNQILSVSLLLFLLLIIFVIYNKKYKSFKNDEKIYDIVNIIKNKEKDTGEIDTNINPLCIKEDIIDANDIDTTEYSFYKLTNTDFVPAWVDYNISENAKYTSNDFCNNVSDLSIYFDNNNIFRETYENTNLYNEYIEDDILIENIPTNSASKIVIDYDYDYVNNNYYKINIYNNENYVMNGEKIYDNVIGY